MPDIFSLFDDLDDDWEDDLNQDVKQEVEETKDKDGHVVGRKVTTTGKKFKKVEYSGTVGEGDDEAMQMMQQMEHAATEMLSRKNVITRRHVLWNCESEEVPEQFPGSETKASD